MRRRRIGMRCTAFALLLMSAGAAPPASAAIYKSEVVWTEAGVYSQPTQDRSYLIKTKHRFDCVELAPLFTYQNGHYYQSVVTSSSPTGYGWMRDDALINGTIDCGA
jgi:hypothetical protein